MSTPAGPRLHLLGSPAVLLAGLPERPLPWNRMTALLAMVACAGDPIGRDVLARRFRPEAPLSRTRADLRRLLHRTREAFADLTDALVATDDSLVWTGTSDVQSFLLALRRGDHAEALGHYRAHFLAGVGSLGDEALDNWVEDERVRWRLRWRQAAAGLLRHERASDLRLRCLRLLVEDDPHDEGNLRLALSHAADPAEVDLVLAGYDAHRRALALDLGARPSDALAAAAQSLRAQAALHPRALRATPPALPSTVPAPRAPQLIGRHGDLARLRTLLAADHPQIVTLCGPGGVGKTELALHLARQWLAAGDDVIWVDLSPAGALGVLHGVAQAIAWPPGHEVTAEALLAQLATRRGWIVFDNAERLGDEALLLAPWLMHTPHLRWLATSRVPLGISAEAIHRLSGLPADGPESEALALLAWHAERQGHSDALRGQGLPSAQRLVQWLDGLPLAIELAATWLPLMSTEQLLRTVQADVSQLTRGVGRARQGHESLQAVFEGSWALLGPQDREALGGLGLFEGSFSHEDGLIVAGCDASTLLRLLSHSLLLRHPMDQAETSGALLGSDAVWGNSRYGLVFDLLGLGEYANPLVILDELDKAQTMGKTSGGFSSPTGVLHSLLEPASAAQVRDISLDLELDASQIAWIATANYPWSVPSTLRSRFKKFLIMPPDAEQAIQLSRSVVRNALKAAGFGAGAPDRRIVVALAHLSAREIFQATVMAAGRAAANGNNAVQLEHLPVAVLAELDEEGRGANNSGKASVH